MYKMYLMYKTPRIVSRSYNIHKYNNIFLVLVMHNLTVIDRSNISALYSITTVETHINNTSGEGSLQKNSTYKNPSETILMTTTDSTDTEFVLFNMSNYKDGQSTQEVLIFKNKIS